MKQRECLFFWVCAAGMAAIECAPPATIGTGSLEVVVTGGLAGVLPQVNVRGPDNFTLTLAQSQSLNGLTPGTYAVTARRYTAGDEIALAVYAPIVQTSPTEVVAGQASVVSVTFVEQVGSGKLWVANTGGRTLASFRTSDLAESGTPTPEVIISTHATDSLAQPSGLAVDPAGDFWVSNCNDPNSTLVKFRRADVFAGGIPKPATVISNLMGSLTCPMGLAFDSHGNLWAANYERNQDFNFTVVAYSPSQQQTGGYVTPSMERRSQLYAYNQQPITNFISPQTIAFDDQGDLWVQDGWGNISGISSADLGSKDGIPETFVSPSTTGGIHYHDGALWLGGAGAFAYDLATLPDGGAVSPNISIIPQVAGLHPTTATFDSAGNLWFAGSHSLIGFAGSQLTTSAEPDSGFGVYLEAADQSVAVAAVVQGNQAFVLTGDDQQWPPHPDRSSLLRFSIDGGVSQPISKITVDPSGVHQVRGIVFDRHGTLWAANCDVNSIVSYPSDQLGNTGSARGSVTLNGLDNGCPQGLAFDSLGNLWVADGIRVYQIKSQQLADSGTVAAAVVIQPPDGGNFPNIPTGLAFDPSGNLWVNQIVADVEYTADQIRVSGMPTPAKRLGEYDTAALAFDSQGSLWILTPNQQIREYGASELSAAFPNVTRTFSVEGGVFLNALTLDNRGHLWVGDDSHSIFEIDPASSDGGTVSPSVWITNAPNSQVLDQIGGLAFFTIQ